MESSVDVSVLSPRGRLRIIPFQVYSGAVNMAYDFFLAENVSPQDDPVLRFYGWKPYCLSLGRHQDLQQINRKRLKADGIDLVRRPTGGSAVLHAQELTYSLIVPGGQEQHHTIYRIFHQVLADALRKMHYDVQLYDRDDEGNYLRGAQKSFACFNRSAYSEIKYLDKKVVGSAQKLFQNSLLQHGSILLSGTQTDVMTYLSISENEKKNLTDALYHSAISLKEINSRNIAPEELSNAIKEQFAYSGVNSIYSKNTAYDELSEIKRMSNQFIV